MSRAADDSDYLVGDELRAWDGSLRFTAIALRALDEALIAGHRISITEFDVLITLFNAPGARLRMTQLADGVLLSRAGLTHLVNRLEKAGLVGRSVDVDDRRGYFANLTAEGAQRLHESRATHNEVVRGTLTQKLDEAQLTSLARIWDTLLPE